MATPVFGDLMRRADAHLAAAARYARSSPADVATAATAEMSRVAASLARYLGDIIPYGKYQAVVVLDMDPALRAIADAREALDAAATAMGPADNSSSPEVVAGRLVAHLRSAAGCLATGRDLLHGHFTMRRSGIEEGRSDWSAAILSAPVRQVLLDHIARQCQRLALTATALTPSTVDSPGLAASTRVALATGSLSLTTAVAALAVRRPDDRVTPAHTRLLTSVPLHSIPGRLPLRGPESAGELCYGAMVSSVRLRDLARQASDNDALSPTATAASWRWGATASAVICHISQLTLGSMAEAAAELVGQLHLSDQLDAAARAADRACIRWRQAAAAWKYITTETLERNATDVAETSDLVARLGRLVGPIEQAAEQLCPDEPMLILRAAAIDKATRRLLSEAGRSAKDHDHARGLPGETPGQTAPRTARDNFPAGPAVSGDNPQVAVARPLRLGSRLAAPRPSRPLACGRPSGSAQRRSRSSATGHHR